jgi:hypothetical protein
MQKNKIIMKRSASRLAGASHPFREQYGLFIDGKMTASVVEDSKMSVENPATTEHLTWVAQATAEDVDIAVRSCQAAYKSGIWSHSSIVERSRLLQEMGAALRQKIPEFAEKESLQTGRPIREMRAQLTRLPGAVCVECRRTGWCRKLAYFAVFCTIYRMV